MSFKRMLGIISVVIVVAFSMMLSTSYAWYSFDNASTVFDGVTNNDDIIINYQHGEYINTNIAIPISQSDVAKYSEKNNFSIRAKDKSKTTELAVTISLVGIDFGEGVTKSGLQDENFKIDLYHQGKFIGNVSGGALLTNADDTKEKLGTVVLAKDIINNFEIRIYILDNGEEQGYKDRDGNGKYDPGKVVNGQTEDFMMNQTFRAKIQIDVVSRLKTSFNDFDNPDIYISSIMIDNESSNSLPTNGYYKLESYNCTKGSKLDWEPLSKTIIYESGSYVNDTCSLVFKSNTDYPLLSEMPVGSYVKYTGANGCVGKSCSGQNANYVSDTEMGYCSSSNYKFIANGWRIGYIEDGSTHLISAGATDCMCTDSSGNSSNSSCSGYLSSANLNKHFENMNNIALDYCNSDYAKGGICDNTTSWAMNAADFEKITGSPLGSSSCYVKYSNITCGYNNSLIDNGGYYWYATAQGKSSALTFSWSPNYRIVSTNASNILRGVRPVLSLESSVFVTGGKGTYDDPYTILNKDY